MLIRTAALGLAILLVSCGRTHDKPNFIYMPDMVYSPAYKAQEEGAMRTPVPGTVFRGYQYYEFAKDPEGAAQSLKNPLMVNMQNLNRGKDSYAVFCAVCHGSYGEGDGKIVPTFPKPPSLHSEKLRNWSDGRIFHVITQGQNVMPSYASQIDPVDRWAIIHYVRVLQRAKNPNENDFRSL